MSTIYEKIQKLCDENGISGSKMCIDLGMSKSFMTELRKGRTKSLKVDTAEKVADYFGITVDYLLNGDESDQKEKQEPKLTPNCIPVDFQKQHAVPILGRVACGVPMYADENIEGYTYTELNGGAEYFALRAKGDSMNAARIHDGDIVVIRKQSIVDDGDIAVILVDDENATMKRFYRTGSTVTLMPQSTNPDHKPQIYDLQKTRIEVLGKVKEVKVIFP